MSSYFVAALFPSFSFCYSHSLNDLNRIRCMTSVTILWVVIVWLYYRSTRTPQIEPAGHNAIFRLGDPTDHITKPPANEGYATIITTTLPLPIPYLFPYNLLISSRPRFLLIWIDPVRGCRLYSVGQVLHHWTVATYIGN